MNVLHIALHEIKLSLRDKRTFIFMMAFPVVLMLILGTALTNAFTSGATVEGLNLLVRSTASDAQLTAAWSGFEQAIAKEGVEVTPIEEGTDGREAVQEDLYAAYAEIGDDGIRFYGSSKHTIESNILQGMLTTFADRYNLAAAALQAAPSDAEAILGNAGAAGGIVRETTLDPDRKPNSVDYYAVVMTTMIGLYACMSASYLIRGERKRNTMTRLSASPVSKGEIFMGKVIGCSFINSMCVIVVFLFSKLAFQADWGDHYGIVLLILVTEVLLAVSLGLGVSYLFKENSASAVMNVFVQIASFIGGAYFPLEVMGTSMRVVSELSPLRWANRGLMNVIYFDDWGAAWGAVGLNLAFAAAFLAVSVISMRRREAL